jgi:hypothetical protein
MLRASDDKLLPCLGLAIGSGIRGSLVGKGIRIVEIASPLENRVSKRSDSTKY